MRVRSRFYLLSAALLLTGVIAFYFRKKLSDAYGHYSSYNELYLTPEGLHITRIRRLPEDQIRIAFDGAIIRPANHFEVFEKGEKILDQTAPALTLRPGQGRKDYSIKINSVDSCSIQIEMPEITIPSIPVLPGRLESPRVWCMFDTLSSEEAGSTDVRHYLEDSMKIRPFEPSEIKVRKIASYILSITSGKFGQPAGFMNQLSPVEQLKCVQAGRSRLLCGGYSIIFSFFANRAGAPCRYIEAGRLLEDLEYTPHVVNEVWLKEYNCWAYVDLTDGIVFATKGGHFLNTLDIQRQLRRHDLDTSYKALHYEGDSLVGRSFEKASVAAIKAFDQNTLFTFYYGRYPHLAYPKGMIEKLKSLLSSEAYYAVYSDNHSPGNDSFYGRLFSGYIFLLVAVIWVWAAFRRTGRRLRALILPVFQKNGRIPEQRDILMEDLGKDDPELIDPADAIIK